MEKEQVSSPSKKNLPCFNILIIGSSESGKSSLFHHFTQNGMTPFHEEAHGVTFSSKVLDLNGSKIKVQFWDLSNTKISRNVLSTYYKSAQGIFLLYDVTDDESYIELSSFIENIKALATPGIPVMILGNKMDRIGERSVQEIRAQNFAKKGGFSFSEISIREKTNLESSLNTLLEEILRRKDRYDHELTIKKDPLDMTATLKMELQNTKILSPENIIFVGCNLLKQYVQTGHKLYQFESFFVVAQMVCKYAKILKVPFILTELDMDEDHSSAAEIVNILEKDYQKIVHYTFSCYGNELQGALSKDLNRKNVILFGCEAHITILPTALDLLKQGYIVHLVTDAITSHNNGDRIVAMNRLLQVGARLITSESLIFELLRDAKHPSFKECLKILKTERPPQIEFSA